MDKPKWHSTEKAPEDLTKPLKCLKPLLSSFSRFFSLLALSPCFSENKKMASIAVRNVNSKRLFTISPSIYSVFCRESHVSSPLDSPMHSCRSLNPWWRSMATFTRTWVAWFNWWKFSFLIINVDKIIVTPEFCWKWESINAGIRDFDFWFSGNWLIFLVFCWFVACF